jgi:hypothetical protein
VAFINNINPNPLNMQTRNVSTPTETRQRMIDQGLDPERVRKILEGSVNIQHQTFMSLYPVLTKEDRIEMELDLLQTELMLSIVSRACFAFCMLTPFFL